MTATQKRVHALICCSIAGAAVLAQLCNFRPGLILIAACGAFALSRSFPYSTKLLGALTGLTISLLSMALGFVLCLLVFCVTVPGFAAIALVAVTVRPSAQPGLGSFLASIPPLPALLIAASVSGAVMFIVRAHEARRAA